MILFLDFDGVLHPISREEGPFTRIEHFERVLRDFPGVDIVISSSWRETFPFDEIRGFFSDDIGQRIIGVTPVLGALEERQTEIELWLRENGREREAWVAVDDSPTYFRDGCPNLIWVDPDQGFNDATERALRSRFAEPRSSTILFLDFDGVLHPDACFVRNGRPFLKGEGALFMWAPVLVEALKGFPKVRIVLSTSWVRVKGYNRAKHYLPPALADRVIGATYHSYLRGSGFADMPRYQQIGAHVARANIQHWIALDDDADAWPVEMLERLVKTDGARGLGDFRVIRELRNKLENIAKESTS